MIHQLLESRNLELHENNNVGENDAKCNNEAVVGKCEGCKKRILFIFLNTYVGLCFLCPSKYYCICESRVPENGEMGALLLSSSPRTRILWLISSVSLLLMLSSRYWLEETVDKNSLNRSRLSLIESIRPCPALVRQKRRDRWMKKKIRWLKLRMMTKAYL
jgi:hypothetical protein